MGKFKVGDRVRYVGNTDNKISTAEAIGRVGVVTATDSSGWDTAPQVNVVWENGYTGYTRPYEYNLVLESPSVSLAEVVEFLRESGFFALASSVKEHFTPKEAVTLKIEGTPEQVKAAQDAIKALSDITVEEVK